MNECMAITKFSLKKMTLKWQMMRVWNHQGEKRLAKDRTWKRQVIRVVELHMNFMPYLMKSESSHAALIQGLIAKQKEQDKTMRKLRCKLEGVERAVHDKDDDKCVKKRE